MGNITRREKEKLAREEDIIAAAEKIFSQKGFVDASMDEIAKEAMFAKRTLYEYFESKEDLYFAVVLKVFRTLFTYLTDRQSNAQTGYLRVREFCRSFYQFYKDRPEAFRVIGHTGNVRQKIAPDSKRLSEFLQLNNNMFKAVADVIAEGKSDGSVKTDLDCEKTALSLVFLMTGFINQLSATGSGFTSHFSLNIDEFSTYTIDLLLNTMKKM